jgi:hypothetical protein
MLYLFLFCIQSSLLIIELMHNKSHNPKNVMDNHTFSVKLP